jgi:hypothetical protein
MEQIKKLEELKGKTIERAAKCGEIGLFFTDETFAIFRQTNLDSDRVEISDEHFSLIPSTDNAYELEDLGVISNEELKDFWNDYREKEAEKKDEKERQNYLMLKEKFED